MMITAVTNMNRVIFPKSFKSSSLLTHVLKSNNNKKKSSYSLSNATQQQGTNVNHVHHSGLRHISTFKGVPFTHTTEEAKNVFAQYARKSWFSPSAYQQPGAIQKYFVPFWIFDFDVTIMCVGRLGRNVVENVRTGTRHESYTRTIWITTEAMQFTDSFRNVSCYAATTFERHLVENAAKSGLEFLSDVTQFPMKSSEYEVDLYTIDSDSAWDVTRYRRIDPMIRSHVETMLRRHYPGYDRYEIEYLEFRFHGNVNNQLIYYPLFVQTNPFLNLFWKGEELRSFLDGRDTIVQNVYGYRHFGFLRTFAASFVSGCVAAPLLAGEGANLLDYYPYITLLSMAIGTLAMYSPILLKAYHNFERERINRFMSQAKATRDKQQQQYYGSQNAYGDFGGFGSYGQENSYYDYERHQRQRRQRQQQQQYQQRQQGGGYQYEQTSSNRGFEAEVRSGKDYYTLLGLDPKKRESYTSAQIQKAYRTSAMKYHPDMHPDPKKKKEMEEKFKQINQAYMVLQDDASRRKYNLYGRD